MKRAVIAVLGVGILGLAAYLIMARSSNLGTDAKLDHAPAIDGALPFRVMFCKYLPHLGYLNHVVVHVQGGKARIGNNEVALADLAPFLDAYTKQAGTKYLVIAHQPEVPLKDVFRYLDACKSLDVKWVIIAIDEEIVPEAK